MNRIRKWITKKALELDDIHVEREQIMACLICKLVFKNVDDYEKHINKMHPYKNH